MVIRISEAGCSIFARGTGAHDCATNCNSQDASCGDSSRRLQQNEIGAAMAAPAHIVPSLKVLVEGFLNHVTRDVADDLLLDLAALEKQKSGYAAYSVALWSSDIFIHIHFRDLYPTVITLCHFVDYGRQRTARTAPRGPKINENGLLGLQHRLVEIRVRYFHNCLTCLTCHVPSRVRAACARRSVPRILIVSLDL